MKKLSAFRTFLAFIFLTLKVTQLIIESTADWDNYSKEGFGFADDIPVKKIY